RHRRVAGGPERGQLPGGPDRQSDPGREAGELAVPGLLRRHAGDPVPGQSAGMVPKRDGQRPQPEPPEPRHHLERAEPGGLHPHRAHLAVPRAAGRVPGLLHPGDHDGHGQPRGGAAGGRPPPPAPSDRHGDRPGLRLGNGRQHHRHLPHRLRPDRRPRHQGRAPAAGGGPGAHGHDPGLGAARRLGGHPPGPLRHRLPADAVDRADRRGMEHPRGRGRPVHNERRPRLRRREQLLLHQGQQRARRGGPPAPHPSPRQPDPRLLHPGPPRAARLRLRAHLRHGRLSVGQGGREDHQGGPVADRRPRRIRRRQPGRGRRGGQGGGGNVFEREGNSWSVV
ncbi:hypothetical protein HK102_012753, partial [Quaeritorhiza haematococci]